MNETIDAVRQLVATTLGIEDRAHLLTADTVLLDGIPELDSMALVELVVALEDRFRISIEDEDITGETFHTLGSLATMVARRSGSLTVP